ncbi:MAG: hypothetical protein IKJ01_08795 [Lachnospiraceae bacterium]|nr:hypothetical protein [Lachnospiraceae bacterium]
MSKESSAVNLTSNFFLQNFYKNNRNAYKTSTRPNYNQTELSYEDSRALKNAIQKLSSFDYSEDENGDNIVSSIQAFAETYNNALSSTSSKDADVYRQNRQLQALSKKYEDELKDIGITIEKDGKLSVSENILKGASFDEVKKVFSNETDYMKNIRIIARRMNATSYDAVYEQMTGAGGKLNIIL